MISQPHRLEGFKQDGATCVVLNFDIILVGTASGQVLTVNRDSGEVVATFKPDGKEFLTNPVTCIDVHQLRPDYCVVGYQQG